MFKKQVLLSKLLLCGFFSVVSTPVEAQITPDNTLRTETSKLTENVLIKGANADLINGGAIRGNNLFHSFTEFNIKDGQRVYFANPSGVVNILTRVTGNNASNIFGTLGVDGAANLFLINPNGILFGKNASLDLRGSFVGTTANGVQFGNQGNFSATNPEAPALLTINPSALFFNQINPNAAIVNNSVVPAGKDPSGFFDAVGLRVPDGKSLLLVGGNIIMDGGQLNAYGGRVELGGLAEVGNVNLFLDGNNFSLGFPAQVARASISLTNTAGIFMTGTGGGNIVINASNIDILDGSVLSTGIGRGLGAPSAIAGDIILNATGEIKVAGSGSQVRNLVRTNSKGNGGNITINAGSLNLLSGAELSTLSFGQGNSGNVTVTAKDGISLTGNATKILSAVEAGGVGNSGDININGATFSLSDGAGLSASNFAQGNAGNVTVTTRDSVSLANNSSIFSAVGQGGVGNGGNITINTGSLKLLSGGELSVSTSGLGNAGNVIVTARDSVSLTDNATIFAQVNALGIGKGGDIKIDAGSLRLKDGALLTTSTSGLGSAGNVIVTARDAISLADNSGIFSTVNAGGVGNGGNIDINGASLSLINGTQLLTATRGVDGTREPGKGNAGNVNVKVSGAVDIAGQKNGFTSEILSIADTGTKGNGGNITIDAGSLNLQNGTQLTASTSGIGNAGDITVRAKNAISLTGNLTSILSTVEAGGVGKGGNIYIDGASLSLTDGAQLITITRGADGTQPAGKGDAGNVNVKVSGSVDIAGEKNNYASGIYSSVETGTEGNGGNITIDAGSLNLLSGAKLKASTSGNGNAGNVTIISPYTTITGQTTAINSQVEPGSVGNGGNITIDADSLKLLSGAGLAVSTFGQGNAGNVTVTAKDTISLDGNASILSTVEAGGIGNGGNIDINGGTFSLTNGAELLTVTRRASDTQEAGKGNAGNIFVKVRGNVDIAGQKNGFFSMINSSVDPGTEGNGGNITIDAGSLKLEDGGGIGALTFGQGNAGTIKINAADFFAISAKNSSLSSALSVTSLSPTGIAGDIIVTSPKITLDNQGLINTDSFFGNGGNINLSSDLLLLRNGSRISTTGGFLGQGGNGGNIDINRAFIVAVPTENSRISADALTGRGGNVTIRTQGLFGIESRAIPSYKTSEITAISVLSVQGNVSITQPDIKPQQGLIELPQEVVDATRQVAQICPRQPGAKPLGEFTITGRGSLPPNPIEALPGTTNDTKLATLDAGNNRNISKIVPNKVQNAIVEAQGWVKNKDGSLELVAMAPQTTPKAQASITYCPN